MLLSSNDSLACTVLLGQAAAHNQCTESIWVAPWLICPRSGRCLVWTKARVASWSKLTLGLVLVHLVLFVVVEVAPRCLFGVFWDTAFKHCHPELAQCCLARPVKRRHFKA